MAFHFFALPLCRRSGSTGRRVISVLGGGFVLLGTLASYSVLASVAFPAGKLVGLARVLPAFSWATLQSMSVAGVNTQYRQFTSSLTVPMTAKKLGGHTALFQHVIVLRNKMVLSGERDGWHWVAELEAYGQATQGVVSALPVTTPQVKSRDQPLMPAPGWLPASAVLKFEHHMNDRGHDVVQRIYRTGMSDAQALDHTASHLKRAGWVRAVWASAPGLQRWRRKDKHLLLAALPTSTATALFMQLQY